MFMDDRKDASPSSLEMNTFTALHDFKERADGELSFQTGDVLEVRQMDVVEEKGFVYLYNTRTMKSGWAPWSYVKKVDACNPSSQTFYFEINRREAEVMLMRPNLSPGIFILRPCAEDKLKAGSSGNSSVGCRSYALSVRLNDQRGMPIVKHYKIEITDDTGSCYIYRKRTFRDVCQLIKFYSEVDVPGMGRLSRPYPHQLSIVPLQQLNIPKDEIHLADRLGNGQFGLVWTGRWKNLQVAVKMTRKSSETEQTADDELAMFLSEATSMASLSHERLVKLIAICTERKPYWIITELMNRGSLRDFVSSKEGRQEVSFYDMIDFMQQITQGMEYLVETMHFCHRDLRAANVMVNRDSSNDALPYELKIGDFGLAKLLDEVATSPNSGCKDEATVEANKNTRLPVKWTPPEALLHRRFSSKSDVWSFGIVCYEIVTFGKSPYRGKSSQEAIVFVERGGRIQLDECHSDEPPVVQCPQELYQIMTSCWRHEPEKRPTFQSLRLMFENYMHSGNWFFENDAR